MSKQDDAKDLEEELSLMPDETLVRIALAKTDEYRPEAIECARSQLQLRGKSLADLHFVQAALAVPTYEQQSREDAKQFFDDATSKPAYPWPSWVLMAVGGLIFFFILRTFDARGPNTNMYLVTFALLFFAASEYEIVRSWRRRSTWTRLQSLKFLLPAAFLLVWSVLLLIGVVHY